MFWSFGLFNCTFKRFEPTLKPFIASIACLALCWLSKLTKPENNVKTLEVATQLYSAWKIVLQWKIVKKQPQRYKPRWWGILNFYKLFLRQSLLTQQSLIKIYTKTFAQQCRLVNKNFCRKNIPKGHEGLHQISISEFRWKMVNEQICTIRPWKSNVTN